MKKCLEFDAAYNPSSSATDDEIRNDLKRFQKRSSKAKYVCSVPGCGYKTPLKGNFDRHQERNHDERVVRALEASTNQELRPEDIAVIRAASESDASCAQIVGAWATSANVLGCEKLFEVMYGGVDASPAEWNEALDEAQEYIEHATAAIENSEEAIARGYLEDRDPAGTVLSCACCGMRQR
jgi:hypothetical protein